MVVRSYGPEVSRAAAIKREQAAAKWASKNLISREVRAMDCTAVDSGMQGNSRRFDAVTCKVRVDVPCFLPGYGRKRSCVEQVPRDFYPGTLFMVAQPMAPYPAFPERRA